MTVYMMVGIHGMELESQMERWSHCYNITNTDLLVHSYNAIGESEDTQYSHTIENPVIVRKYSILRISILMCTRFCNSERWYHPSVHISILIFFYLFYPITNIITRVECHRNSVGN